MVTSPTMRIGLLGLLFSATACFSTVTPPDGRGRSEPSGSSGTHDAAPGRRAPAEEDASVSPSLAMDAGALPPPLPLGRGCYGETALIASGEGGRFSINGSLVVGHRDGWIVIYRTPTGSRVALLGSGGEVFDQVDFNITYGIGPDVRAVVRGGRLVLFSRNAVQRIDFNPDALGRVYEPLRVDSIVLSSLDADPFEQFFRFVAWGGSRIPAEDLWLAEVGFDGEAPTGLSLITGSLADVAPEIAYNNPVQLEDGSLRLFLDDDHLFAFLDNPRQPGFWRTLDIQLGIDALGAGGRPLSYRVWDTSAWSDGPLSLSERHASSGRLIGLDDSGPAPTRARGYELGVARDRAPVLVDDFNAYTDDDQHAVLADAYGEVHFYRADDFTEVAGPIDLDGRVVLGRSWPPNGYFAATVDIVRDDGTSAIGLRCFQL